MLFDKRKTVVAVAAAAGARGHGAPRNFPPPLITTRFPQTPLPPQNPSPSTKCALLAEPTANTTTTTTTHTQNNKSSMTALHKDIAKFAEENTLRPQEIDIRRALKSLGPNTDVECFGSSVTGILLATSDLDIVVQANEDAAPASASSDEKRLADILLLKKIRDLIARWELYLPDTLELISAANVPLVKYIDRYTLIRVDITVNNLQGPHSSAAITEWVDEYPQLLPLGLVLKEFLRQESLNEVYSGGIGWVPSLKPTQTSPAIREVDYVANRPPDGLAPPCPHSPSGYLLLCLLVFLFKQKPHLVHPHCPTDNLGEILLAFFNYYIHFDYKKLGMRPKDGKTFLKSKRANADKISVIDPVDPTHDVGRSCRGLGAFEHALRRVYFPLYLKLRDGTGYTRLLSDVVRDPEPEVLFDDAAREQQELAVKRKRAKRVSGGR
ncbi:hypothetical protein BDK51DRAFT_34021 [Blyttiomyces helicus]|uniref:polynucleotide adenylyltransferase n=1 Tax=Blyttiomyces helicus TaxID=388810 RepID=A0A4P9WNV2_9FUNG|nr:hypothetical protein BDK51DRAFT_34021 [Blyttiomyces helicus]|eukprot:RKO92446.1 hypothetical protein BDK51DRAFT_34021 [Blyttiomyces helicus]